MGGMMLDRGESRHWLVVVVLLLSGWPLVAWAQTPAEIRQQTVGDMIGLMQRAQALQAEGKDGEAFPLLERAVALGEGALEPDALPLALALEMLGMLHRKADDTARAEPLFQRGLAIREKVQGPEHPDVAPTLTTLATMAVAREDLGRAEKLYQRALAIQQRALGPEHQSVAMTLYHLGTLLHRQGDYGRAEPLLRRALAVQEQALGADHLYVALSLNNLAFLLFEKSDYASAESLYLRSLAVQEKALGTDHSLVANTMNNLAVLYRVRGDYLRAEPLASRALAIQEKVLGPEHPDVAITLTTLALLHDEKGDHARALPLLQRALAIREHAFGPESTLIATTLENIASVMNQQGDAARAEALYRRALAIKEKVLGVAHPLVATTLNNLAALVSSERRELPEAEALLRRALTIRETTLGPEHPDVAIVLNNLAHLSFIQGEFNREEALYQRALAITERSLGPRHPAVATYLSNLATIYWGRGDVPRTVTALGRASEIREHNLGLVLTTGSEEQKRRYMATLNNETDATVAFHTQVAPRSEAAAELAFRTILRRKGRVLDAMTDQIAALRNRLDNTDRALLDEWSAARGALAQLALQDGDRRPAALRVSEKARLEAEVERLDAAISARSAVFRAEAQPVTLSGVQQAIPDDMALVEIVLYRPYDPRAAGKSRFGAARYAAYALWHRGPPRWVDLGDAAAIDREVERLRRALHTPTNTDVRHAGRALDDLVMRPLRGLLGETRHLLLSADGVLNLVPFGALVDEQGRYLVENYAFVYLTSGRDLLRLHTSVASREAAVVVANPAFEDSGSPAGDGSSSPSARRSADLTDAVFEPLPGTQQEAMALTALLPNVTVLTGAQATEGQLKRVRGPRILHIATHGFFLADQPERPEGSRDLLAENPLLRSGLALAGANQRAGAGGEDGVLTALEAAGLDLSGTRLVVLSACETGVGEVRNGDGVYGLRRALVLAGVESQVMSLWQVSDEATRDLMVGYYERLQRGAGRAEALREVQLAMLQHPTWSHPFFWAGFIHLGDWRKLTP
jgi:CHAT domain-containing protein/Tfp pilus assembly protein PilF